MEVGVQPVADSIISRKTPKKGQKNENSPAMPEKILTSTIRSGKKVLHSGSVRSGRPEPDRDRRIRCSEHSWGKTNIWTTSTTPRPAALEFNDGGVEVHKGIFLPVKNSVPMAGSKIPVKAIFFLLTSEYRKKILSGTKTPTGGKKSPPGIESPLIRTAGRAI